MRDPVRGSLGPFAAISGERCVQSDSRGEGNAHQGGPFGERIPRGVASVGGTGRVFAVDGEEAVEIGGRRWMEEHLGLGCVLE